MTLMSKRLLRALTDKARDAMKGIKTASILNTGNIAFRKYSLGSRKTQMTETTMPKSRCQRKGRVNGREGESGRCRRGGEGEEGESEIEGGGRRKSQSRKERQ